MNAPVDPGDTAGRAIRGGAAIMASNTGRQLLRLGVTVVLARLLTPEEFGLVAIMTAIVAVLGVFLEIGLSAATVQRAHISDAALGTLFWINTGLGLLLTLTCVALSPWIAAFFARPELLALSCVVGLSFLLNGLGVQHRALLQRNMQFRARARINLASALAGGGAALLLALGGAGYWALAGQLLVTDLLALVLLMRAQRFVPGRPRGSAEVGELLRFALPLLGFNLVLALAQNLCVALLGRSSGAASAGLYTRAFALAIIPQNLASGAAEHVALPRLAQFRDAPDRYAASYLLGVRTALFVTLPVAVMFAVAGDAIAHVVYGGRWTEVGALLRAFAPGLAVAPLLYSTGQIFLSRGESARMFRWGLFGSVLIGMSTLTGVRWGAPGVAWAWSASMLILIVPGLAYGYRGTAITLRALLRAVAGVYAAAALMAAVAFALESQVAGLGTWLQLPLVGGPALLAYLAGSWAVFGQRELIQTVGGQLLRRRGGGA